MQFTLTSFADLHYLFPCITTHFNTRLVTNLLWQQTTSWNGFVAQTLQGFFSCLPLRWLGAFTTCDAMDGEAAGATSSEDVSPQGKPFLTASRTRSPGCREQQLCQSHGWEVPGTGSQLGSGDIARLVHAARSAATATGLGCSFTTFSSYNSAIPRKGNLSNFFLIIILWNGKKLQQ